MPRKKSGMPFEVYPTPVKGKNGRNILFAKPAGGPLMRITEEQIDNYVAKYSLLNRGQLKLVLEEFKHWAAEMMAKGEGCAKEMAEMTEEQKAECEAKKAECEAKCAEMKAAWENFGNMTVDEQKDLVMKRLEGCGGEKGCCKGEEGKCEQKPAE